MIRELRRELLRKGIHTAVGFLAFLVVFLGPLRSAILALALVLWNLFLLPRIGGRRLWRGSGERDVGIAAYPIAVLALVLAVWAFVDVQAERVRGKAVAIGGIAMGTLATLVMIGSLPEPEPARGFSGSPSPTNRSNS